VVGDDNLSNADQVSAGGTRYAINFKSQLKFYGNNESGANINDSQS